MEFLRFLSQRIPLLKNSRPLRFLIAGGTAAAVNFSILYTLTEYAHVWYLASAVVALSFGFITSFTLQKFWTFRNMPLTRVHVQASQHLMLSLANIAVNLVFLYVFVEYLHIWYMFAQGISAGMLATVNYFVYRSHIFRE